MASQALKISALLAMFLLLELASGCPSGRSKKTDSCSRPSQTVFFRENNCCCKQPCSETLIVQEDTCSPCSSNPCNPYPCGCGLSYYSYPVGCCKPYNPCCNPCNPCCAPTRIYLRQPECCNRSPCSQYGGY